MELICPGVSSRRSLLAGLGAAAAGLSVSGLEGCAPKGKIGKNGEEQKLNLYNWDTYTGKTTLSDFKAATGIDVNMSLFATNDELFAKLKAGNPGFDVIVPSNEFVTRFRISGLVYPEARPGQDPQQGQSVAGVPEPALRSRPSLFHALHLAGAGHRLSQVQDGWRA